MRLVFLVLVLAATTPAYAQVAFPDDAEFVPLRCRNAPMNDRLQDQAGAIAERDLVGNAAAPAGLRASDDTNLYLRIRLDQDPLPVAGVRPFAWGMQFDLDGDLATYELMILADGIAGAAKVNVFKNTATTLANDPNDPADQPAAATFPLALNGRSVVATGSTFANDDDFFLDIAVPWSALIPLGLDRDTPTHVWAGSSGVATGLDGDLACHNGAGGAAALDVIASDPTTGDPAIDPLGGAGRLEGGGGCSAGSGGSAWVALGLLGLVFRRRRSAFRDGVPRISAGGRRPAGPRRTGSSASSRRTRPTG